MKDNTDKLYSLEETMRDAGYQGEHINFCNMLMEILEKGGMQLGHTTIAELMNIIHYAHLMTLVSNEVIQIEDEENPETPTVMRFSATFAENIMNTAKAFKKEKKE